MVLVFHLYDGFAVNALLDVVNRTLAFYNHDLKAGGSLTPYRNAREIEQ
jgi:hypothetical protein